MSDICLGIERPFPHNFFALAKEIPMKFEKITPYLTKIYEWLVFLGKSIKSYGDLLFEKIKSRFPRFGRLFPNAMYFWGILLFLAITGLYLMSGISCDSKKKPNTASQPIETPSRNVKNVPKDKYIDFNDILENAGFNPNSDGITAYLTYGSSDLMDRSQNADAFDKKAVQKEVSQWRKVNLRNNSYKFSIPITDVLVSDNYNKDGIKVRFYLPFFLQNFVNEMNDNSSLVSFTTEGEHLRLNYCLDNDKNNIGNHGINEEIAFMRMAYQLDKKTFTRENEINLGFASVIDRIEHTVGKLYKAVDQWNEARGKEDCEARREKLPFMYKPLSKKLWCIYILKAPEEILKDLSRHKENYSIVIKFNNFQISYLNTPNVMYPYTISNKDEFLSSDTTIPVSNSPEYTDLYPSYYKTDFPNCQLLSLEIQKNDGTIITKMKYKKPSSTHKNFRPHWKQALTCENWR